MTIRFHPIDQWFVDQVRGDGGDAYGRPAERKLSDGAGTPCRSCLHDVPKGADMLVLAARPFPDPQPYAETGPVFLCAEACAPWHGAGIPPILTTSPDYLLKGYSVDHRIIYGTGRVTPAAEIVGYAEALFERPEVAYVDVRSARNNCFQTRITHD